MNNNDYFNYRKNMPDQEWKNLYEGDWGKYFDEKDDKMNNLDNLQKYCCNTFYQAIKNGKIKYFDSIKRYVEISGYWSIYKLDWIYDAQVLSHCHYCGKILIKDKNE